MVLVARLLPPGERKYQVAQALGLVDLADLEARTVAALLELRRPGGNGMLMEEIQQRLLRSDRGVYVSLAWLSETYSAITPARSPARPPARPPTRPAARSAARSAA